MDNLRKAIEWLVEKHLVADAIVPFRELRRLIDAEPVGVVVVLDLRDLVLADRDAIRYCSRSRTS